MPHKVHVDSLPFELLVNVFQLLGQKDLCRCCRVMKRWNLILYDSPTLWKTLVLSNQLSLGGDKQFNAVSSPSNSSGRGRAPPPVSNIPSLSDTSTTSATAVIATSSDANYFEKSDSRIYIDGGHFPILNEGANQRLFQLLLSSPSSSRFSSLSKLELSYTNIDLAIFSDVSGCCLCFSIFSH